MKVIIKKLEKITGADKYPEKPNRLKNLSYGAMAGLISCLLLLFISKNYEVVSNIGFILVLIFAISTEIRDQKNNDYFNACHLMMKILGGCLICGIFHIVL